MATRMRKKGQVPKASVVEPFAAKFEKTVKNKEISLEDLLKDLRKIRHKK